MKKKVRRIKTIKNNDLFDYVINLSDDEFFNLLDQIEKAYKSNKDSFIKEYYKNTKGVKESEWEEMYNFLLLVKKDRNGLKIWKNKLKIFEETLIKLGYKPVKKS